ncbi:hypothetical protein E2C01_025224 [Portunus trituberculatus]|uniref:Uncharacterized protein n=1 Tax=Portunus trituberculatus TaxID=210409 RepID=A0A5B7EHA4_PORTR|nr:hypothetical protein [Portunus trituberculatus]
MYASMPDTITSVMRSPQRDVCVSDTEAVIIPGKTSSGPPNWQRQNARGTFALGDPAEGLEK